MSFIVVMNALQVYLKNMYLQELAGISGSKGELADVSISQKFEQGRQSLKTQIPELDLVAFLNSKTVFDLIHVLQQHCVYRSFGRPIMLLWLHDKVEKGIELTKLKLKKNGDPPKEGARPVSPEQDLYDYFFSEKNKADPLVKYIADRTADETFRKNLMFYQQVAMISFQILKEHHVKKPVFIDQDLDAFPHPFLQLSHTVLSIYLILSQLSQWTFEVHKKVDKHLTIELVPGRVSIVQDEVIRKKVSVAMGILAHLHTVCNVPNFLDKKTASALLNVYLEDAVLVRPDSVLSSMRLQRLESLLQILLNATQDYFPNHCIELVAPEKLPTNSAEGILSVACTLVQNLSNMAVSLVFRSPPTDPMLKPSPLLLSTPSSRASSPTSTI